MSRSHLPRFPAALLLLGTSLALAGCSSRLQSFTGSLGDTGKKQEDTMGTGALADLAKRYDSRPGEKQASLAYAAALRGTGQYQQAVAVLQRASVKNIGDKEVAAAYGKALADIGQFEQASAVLSQAHSEDRPDWRVLSTLGSISDQQGQHSRARDFYTRALQIAPDEPSILNNLGLSYVLTRELALAEETLRKAASRPGADPRVKANLALAQRLRGKNADGAPIANAAPATIQPMRGLGAAAPRWAGPAPKTPPKANN